MWRRLSYFLAEFHSTLSTAAAASANLLSGRRFQKGRRRGTSKERLSWPFHEEEIVRISKFAPLPLSLLFSSFSEPVGETGKLAASFPLDKVGAETTAEEGGREREEWCVTLLPPPPKRPFWHSA